MKFTASSDSFDRHRASPSESIDEYVNKQIIALGESVMARERIYLDMRYWIILRDVYLGRRKDGFSTQLLVGIIERVGSKRSVCPISETTFFELYKQADPLTRRMTAKLIDELSEGITLQPYDERVAIEIKHFFYSQLPVDLYSLPSLVWSKLSYVLGIIHPTIPELSNSEILVMQKSFFDHMWQCPLSDMVDLMGDKLPPHSDYNMLAEKLNEGSAQHAHEIRSFSQAYLAEIRGSISVFIGIACDIFESIESRFIGDVVDRTEERRLRLEHVLFNFLCSIIGNESFPLYFRTLHIWALCHAAIRWDKHRKITGNDLHDFSHAAAAVGYCDVFLTEQPLKTTLQQHVQ